MSEQTVILAYLFGIPGIAAASFCARWTLGPLEHAAANSKARVHFTIADILCLFAQIQLLLGMIYREARGMTSDSSELLLTVVVSLSVVVLAIWYGSVVLLERAGVRNVWHRVFVLFIGTPVGTLGSAVLCAIPVISVLNATERKWELLWLAPLALVLLGLLAGIRFAIQRIVAAAQRPNEEQP